MDNSIKNGSSATGYKQNFKLDAKGNNSPDSILGGSAATNFNTSPEFAAPMGGADNVSDMNKGGTYKVETKVQSGEATNDRTK